MFARTAAGIASEADTEMYVATPAKIVDERRITGLGIGSAVIFVLAAATLLGLGLWVGFDQASWSTSGTGQRMAAAGALGIASGSLFALVADVARRVFR